MLRSRFLACLACLSVLAFSSAPLAAQPEATTPGPIMALPDARIAFMVGEACPEMSDCPAAYAIWDVETNALTQFGSDYLGDPESLRPSPAGDMLAWTDSVETGWDTVIMNLGDMRIQRIATPDIDEGFIKWSPDGQYLAYTMTQDDFQSWHLGVITRSGEPLPHNITALNVGGFVWNPDSHSLTVGAYGRERDYLTSNLFTLNLEDGSLVPLLARAGGEVPLMWSRDGEHLLYQIMTRPNVYMEYTAYQLDVNTGESIPVFAEPFTGEFPQYTLNNEAVVYWTANSRPQLERAVRLYHLTTGEDVQIIPEQEVRGFNISADGEWMVYNVREIDDSTPANTRGRMCIVHLRTIETTCFPHLPIYSVAIPVWIPYPGLEGG